MRTVTMPEKHGHVIFLLSCVAVYLGAGRANPTARSRGSDLSLDTPIVAIGRCRVLCVKNFPLQSNPNTKTRASRQRKHQREECWKLCEDLVSNPKVYTPLCDRQDCYAGCQTACSSKETAREASDVTQPAAPWVFPGPVDTRTDYQWIYMRWEAPRPQAPSPSPSPESRPLVPHHHIVYNLLMCDKDEDAWQLLDQTAETRYVMEHDEASFVPEFLLQAVDVTGVIAEQKFRVEGMIFEGVLETGMKVGALKEGGTAVSLWNYNLVNLTYHFRQNETLGGGGLSAVLTWQHPPEGQGQGHGQDGHGLSYTVIYIREECGVYEDLPMCSTPGDLYTNLAFFKRNEQPHYTITGLLYNTGYTVRVQESDVDLVDIFLTTPRCHAPSVDFRQCHDPVATETPGVTMEPTQGWVSELVRDLSVRLLPSSVQPGYVLVNISWNFISDPAVVNFSLKIVCDNSASGISVTREIVSGATHLVARLLDNTICDVVVDVFDPSRGGELEYAEDWDEDVMYLDDSRQSVHFNTSSLQLAARERPLAVRMNRQKLRAVNGVIIGVTCVGVLVVLGFIVLFLYKKRQSFKGIIIPKTTVAKSNSYKSSVGGKADYSNQLMVFSDEWELDPRTLTFSTPLGQGAFGKVVTGYCADRKVAIKLVKEGAPVSYKEDLVAEITLMKRLGSHPNIVCLIGACTRTEPIALVMEYVPYGNLQNFLKKCRLEGDLQKRGDGPGEIQYSMLQDCGGIENGVITPTDMLSFARQVAMAMEYLAEKKYVHRDLAARNVLLHYHKVVKVCDFGLSRDIFNDNQYKKLTNGKLPLKWMAIESLRERVFTTQSDVWSFGILLWEIVTMGASPYPNIALADLYYVLSNNYRMDKPSNCSNELYELMRSCWADEPLARPSFTELREELEELMCADRDYLVLEMFDVPLSASDSSSSPPPSDLFVPDMRPSPAALEAVSASSESSSSASASAAAGASASALLRQGAPLRRPPMTINVCIHQKSTERLVRPSESDSSP